MPSVAERRRNNVKAGIFVTLTLLLAVAVIGVLTGIQQTLTTSYTNYTVTFDVAHGVKNIQEGAAVRVGGLTLGQVTSVHPIMDDTGNFTDTIAVDFKLDRRVHLYSNAVILARAALIGTESWLDIVRLGGADPGAPGDDADAEADADAQMLSAGDAIAGRSGPPLLETVFGPQSTQLRDDIVEFANFLADLDDRYDRDVKPTLNNFEQASGHVRDVTSAVKQEHLPHWSDRVDNVLDWANKATNTLDSMFDESQRLVADTRGVINDSRDPVMNTLKNTEDASVDVREMASHLREQTLPKFEQLLATGQSGLEEAETVVQRFHEQFDENAVDINESLGNARLASEQLRLAAAEIRRSPWKLLYRPGPKELEHELLYEAARSFAVATADLKAAALSTKTILDRHGDALAENEKLAERLRTNLLDPLNNYERAQQRLYEVLLLDEAPAASNENGEQSQP